MKKLLFCSVLITAYTSIAGGISGGGGSITGGGSGSGLTPEQAATIANAITNGAPSFSAGGLGMTNGQATFFGGGNHNSIATTNNWFALLLGSSLGGEIDFTYDPITTGVSIGESSFDNWNLNIDGGTRFGPSCVIANAGHAEGYGSTATGLYSHAAGVNAYATNDYTFVWNGDPATNNSSSTNSQFNVYAPNGIRLLGGPITGNGGSLSNINLGLATNMLPMGTVAYGFTNVSGPMLISNNAARYYSYNGNALTNLDATKLTGTVLAANLPGTRIIYSAMTPYNTISSGLTYWSPIGQGQSSATVAGRAAMIVPVSGLITNFYFREFSAGALGTGTNLVAYIFTNAPGGSATSAGVTVTITGSSATSYAATNLTQGFYLNAGTEMVVGISNTAGTTASSQCNLSFTQILQ